MASHVSLIEYDLLTDDAENLAAKLPLLPQTVVMVAGLLGSQEESAARPDVADIVIRTNFVAPARLLLAFAAAMRARGSGTIIGVSSVAGDRGRASNYIYGASKAGLTAFLSGMRNSLSNSGVPGYHREAGLRADKNDGAPQTTEVSYSQSGASFRSHSPGPSQAEGSHLCPGTMAGDYDNHPIIAGSDFQEDTALSDPRRVAAESSSDKDEPQTNNEEHE